MSDDELVEWMDEGKYISALEARAYVALEVIAFNGSGKRQRWNAGKNSLKLNRQSSFAAFAASRE
jgi:hypothetical protein